MSADREREISQELLEMMVSEEKRVVSEESRMTLKNKAASVKGSRPQVSNFTANTEECPPPYPKSKTLKELATLEELMMNNSEDGVETIRRRRANSLHQDSDRNTRALKAANRYSLFAAGDKDGRKEFQSNMIHRRSVSASNANNGGSSNLIEKTTNGSKGRPAELHVSH